MSMSRCTNGQQVNHFSSSRTLERGVGKGATRFRVSITRLNRCGSGGAIVLLTRMVELMRRATTRWTPTYKMVRVLSHSLTASPCSPCISTMTDNPKRQKGRGRVVPALDTAIAGLNIVKEATSTTPINPVFGSVATLLAVIRVSSLPSRDERFCAYT